MSMICLCYLEKNIDESQDVKLVLIRGLSGEKMFALEIVMDKRKGERGKNEP